MNAYIQENTAAIIAALIGVFGVLLGSVVTYCATLRAQRKRTIDENFSAALSAFCRSYSSYCKSKTKNEFVSLLASLDCVRLFCPNEALPLVDDLAQSLAAETNISEATAAIYRKLIELSRKKIHQY